MARFEVESECVTLIWGISTEVGGFLCRFGGRSNAVLSAWCAYLVCCVVPTFLNGEISISMPRNISATALNPCWTGGGFLALGMVEEIGVIVGKVIERDVGWEDSRMEYDKRTGQT